MSGLRERLRSAWDRLHSSYWFVPAIMCLVSGSMAFLILQLDIRYRDDALREQGWLYSGGAEGARAVLSTIAGSVMTVAGTTFSITIAVLSLASNQFGPRLLRSFMRDTANQVVLGTFTSTFLYCLLILRTVRGLDENTYVPHISVTVAVFLAVINLGVLIFFIHHIAESIQVAHVINTVSQELDEAVDRIFPEGLAEPAEGPQTIPEVERVEAESDGYLQVVDEDRLLRSTREHDVQVRLLSRPGDYILSGTPLAMSSRRLNKEEQKTIRHCFVCGRARTPHQDIEFAFLQMAEIAIRALSPGINDPFTATMCVDRISSAINRLGQRSLPLAVRRDGDGVVRVVAHRWTHQDVVEAGYGRIWEYARDHSQVVKELRSQVKTVMEMARDPELRAALRRQLEAMG
jgi:uncharacterized membrane protein